ncbi:28S ribosomal protein S24, mitochondrial [Octopus bimaculoides]|uniref:28S ribosomal protein S24, mitochondrial n=1 Tax=Octopus bimaculoides TaxID=37653 RepID=A0A0L8HZF2_OCTBM|nr:28S ribosomal protein S24, mitochondrial [Octopus bimaculoides]|eukprot:XP_014768081.1 PREDICTED: 28S ribosomal protein S24, mitochondrial-like [Octopus bimaculoides]
MSSYFCSYFMRTLKPQTLSNHGLTYNLKRQFSKSSVLNKNVRAAQPKISLRQDKPLTYEKSQPPYLIGVTKTWNSWNTSTLLDEGRTSEITVDDIFIRRFMHGTWPRLLMSDVIIKRRHNLIVVAALISQNLLPQKIYFLQGYTEEMLSYILKCPIRLEIQTVKDKKDIIFKYI